jgi:glutamyl-tRNA synthetase
MESIKLSELMSKYWDDNGWVPPSQEWAYKLANLLRDSMTLLKDAIDQSKPFFLIPTIQKEGQDFLESNDSKACLKLILNYLIKQKVIKLNKEKAKEIINEISKMHNVKKGILMKSLRVAFFGSVSGPDLIQSWELFSESKTDRSRIERCLKSI